MEILSTKEIIHRAILGIPKGMKIVTSTGHGENCSALLALFAQQRI